MTKDDLINPLDQEYTIKLTKREFGFIEHALIMSNAKFKDDIDQLIDAEEYIDQFHLNIQHIRQQIEINEKILTQVITFNNEIFRSNRRLFLNGETED